MTSKLVVNTIESDTGISSVSFASSISMSSTSKFFFSAAGIDIGADTNINRPASGVLGFNINGSEKARIDSSGNMGQGTTTPTTPDGSNADNPNNGKVFTIYGDSPAINLIHNTAGGGSAGSTDYAAINFGRNGSSSNPYRAVIGYKQVEDILHINANNHIVFDTGGNINTGERLRIDSVGDVFIGRTSGLSNAKLSVQCDTGEAAIAAQMNTASSTASNLLMAYNSAGVNIANISCVTTATPDLTFNLWNGSSTAQKMRISSGGAVEIGTGTGSGGGGLAIYGGTVNQSSGQDAALYVRHDSSADWGMWLYKQHEYGFRIDSNSSATLSFAIYDQSNNIKHQFKGNGDYTAQGFVDSASDVKLKTNIKTIDSALDKVLKLRGAEYDRIDKDNEHEIGVIAQEVEKVIPELVHGEETKTVSYGNIAAVLIEAIKEQNEVINKMKKEIEDLKG